MWAVYGVVYELNLCIPDGFRESCVCRVFSVNIPVLVAHVCIKADVMCMCSCKSSR